MNKVYKAYCENTEDEIFFNTFEKAYTYCFEENRQILIEDGLDFIDEKTVKNITEDLKADFFFHVKGYDVY